MFHSPVSGVGQAWVTPTASTFPESPVSCLAQAATDGASYKQQEGVSSSRLEAGSLRSGCQRGRVQVRPLVPGADGCPVLVPSHGGRKASLLSGVAFMRAPIPGPTYPPFLTPSSPWGFRFQHVSLSDTHIQAIVATVAPRECVYIYQKVSHCTSETREFVLYETSTKLFFFLILCSGYLGVFCPQVAQVILVRDQSSLWNLRISQQFCCADTTKRDKKK